MGQARKSNRGRATGKAQPQWHNGLECNGETVTVLTDHRKGARVRLMVEDASGKMEPVPQRESIEALANQPLNKP
jgi:hypothetical protein